MVNFGLNAAAILGLFLAVAGAGLFFLRSIRPELARDYDIFFAAVGLLCGIILLFNGWRLDPILQFGQFLLTGTAIFFAFESIRMRGAATEQARRNTPTVDRDRPVSRSRVYTEAELDKIDPYDNVYDGATPNYNSPRLRGYEEPQPRPSRRPAERKSAAAPMNDGRSVVREDPRQDPRSRRGRSRPEPNNYADDYAERPRSSGRRPSRKDSPDQSSRRSAPVASSYDDWNVKDEWDDGSRPAPRPSRRPTRDERFAATSPAPVSAPAPAPNRRPNPANLADLGRSYDESAGDYDSEDLNNSYDNNYDDSVDSDYRDREAIPGDYVVDYQPLDTSEADYAEDYDQDDYDSYDDYDDPANDDPEASFQDQPKRTPINFDE